MLKTESAMNGPLFIYFSEDDLGELLAPNNLITVWKVSKYGVFSDSNTGKYRWENAVFAHFPLSDVCSKYQKKK